MLPILSDDVSNVKTIFFFCFKWNRLCAPGMRLRKKSIYTKLLVIIHTNTFDTNIDKSYATCALPFAFNAKHFSLFSVLFVCFFSFVVRSARNMVRYALNQYNFFKYHSDRHRTIFLLTTALLYSNSNTFRYTLPQHIHKHRISYNVKPIHRRIYASRHRKCETMKSHVRLFSCMYV